MKKLCVICAKEFEARNDRATLDSLECRIAARRKRQREWKRRDYVRNYDTIIVAKRIAGKRYRDRNPEKHRAKSRSWTKLNPVKKREQGRRWRANNLEKSREQIRQYFFRSIRDLSESYLRGVMMKQKQEITKENIELCKQRIHIHRTRNFLQLTAAASELLNLLPT